MIASPPRDIYSAGERAEILRQYTDRGWQLVRLRGYHRTHNPDRAYNKGKVPADNGWPKLRPTLSEAIDWMQADGWIGLVVPPGCIALDIDDPEAVSWLLANAEPTWTISRTKNGYHVLFLAGDHDISGASALSRAGIKITYRAAGKNQIVVAPSPCREWLQWFPDTISEIPEGLLPIPKAPASEPVTRVIEVIRRLFDAAPGAKHDGRVKGSRLLGGVIAGGAIADGDPVVEELVRFGVSHSTDPRAAEHTIRTGITNGMLAPIRDLGGYAAGVRRPEGVDVIEGPSESRAAADVAVDVAYLLSDRGWFRSGEVLHYKAGERLVSVVSQSAPEWRTALQMIRWWDQKKGFGRALSAGVLEAAWVVATHLLPERDYIGGPGVVGDSVVMATTGGAWVIGGPWAMADCPPANSAKWIIDEVFCDFAFGRTEDYLRAFAELVTGFLFGAFSGPVPMFLHHASTPGAGKTLLAEVIGTIIDGAPARFSGDSDDTERGKRIFGLLAGRTRYAYIDNQKEKFGGQQWESLCTSRDFEERVMHTQQMRKVDNDCLWCVTGNNVPISPDMARRLVIIDVDSHGVQRDTSAFRHVPLLSWVREHRREIVGHVLRVLDGWCRAGYPRGKVTPASYEDWGAVVSGVMSHVFGSCPALIDREGAALAHDSRTQAWMQIVHEWADSSIGETPSSVAVIADKLAGCPWGEIVKVTGYANMQAAVNQALCRAIGQVYDGLRIDREWHPRQHRFLYSVSPLLKTTHEG
jgi:hypothetical protein